MFTHFSKPIDEKYTTKQFNEYKIENLHCCASTAFLKYPSMWLDSVRIGSALQGRTLVCVQNLKKIGLFKTNIIEIKNLPKGYNISYGNTYKTKKQTQIAIIPIGYIDGFNKNKLRDDFSLKNNVIAVFIEIRKIFKDNSLKVKIDGKSYKVLGKLGMYHSIIDISENENIEVGQEVEIDISPLQANDKIRREYI